ncbi:MAG: hypothetical protein KatS3mg065_0176 [Chloroflexota bacterium]|nr:MAG: hypothetical protein KatS3mg065_0176 [Chloroflexota bacterium]
MNGEVTNPTVQRPRRPSRAVRAVVVGVAAIALVGLPIGMAAAPPPKDDLVGVFGATNTEFPDPAFLVNGEPVSGQALARSVAVFEYQARQLGNPLDHRTAIKQAVERLAVQVRLRQMAEERGYAVSDAELDAYLSGLVAQARQSAPDPGNLALLAAGGYPSWEAYVADPAVRAEYRNALLVNKLISELLAADPGLTAEDLQAKALADAKIELRFSP